MNLNGMDDELYILSITGVRFVNVSLRVGVNIDIKNDALRTNSFSVPPFRISYIF